MEALSLFKNTSKTPLPFNLTKLLGSGADGELYELNDNKVIKLSVLYEKSNIEQEFTIIQSNINYLISNNISHFVKVFDFNYLIKGSDFNREYIIYYYIMEKLLPISEDEYKVFHSIISHEDSQIKKDHSILKIEKMLEGLAKGLDFDKKNIIMFYNSILDCSLLHLDLHPRNIMKDEGGYFKLVDLDRLLLNS